MRSVAFKDLDKACYRWFLNGHHQNAPVNGNNLKTNALYFDKKHVL